MLCQASLSQLLIVDMQERLLAAMPQAEAVTRACDILLQAARLLDVAVVATEQYPRGLGKTVEPVANHLDSPFEKTRFSCCGAEGLADNLRGGQRRQLVLAGIEAHVCVLQTAMELHSSGYDVFVVEDACCSRNPDHHANAMHRLRQAGIVVTNVESVLFEWLRDAGHPQFKAVSALLR